jgi:hypothetical protein
METKTNQILNNQNTPAAEVVISLSEQLQIGAIYGSN